MGEYCGYPLVCNFLSINAYQPAMPWHRNKPWKVQTSLISLNHLVTTVGAERRRTQESHGSWSLSLLFLHELIICWSIRVFPLLGGPDLQLAGCDKGWPDNSFIVPAPGSHLLGSTKAIARCAPFPENVASGKIDTCSTKADGLSDVGSQGKLIKTKENHRRISCLPDFFGCFKYTIAIKMNSIRTFDLPRPPARPPKGPTAHVLFLTTEMSSLPESDLREIDSGTYWSFPEICMVTPTQPEPTFLVCFVVLWHAYAI